MAIARSRIAVVAALLGLLAGLLVGLTLRPAPVAAQPVDEECAGEDAPAECDEDDDAGGDDEDLDGDDDRDDDRGDDDFSDVPRRNPHAEAIRWLAETGVTQGCGARHFCPRKPVTRAEFARFAFRLSGGEDGEGVFVTADEFDGLVERVEALEAAAAPAG